MKEAKELVMIAKELTATGGIGSTYRLLKDAHTKKGVEFKQGEELRLKEYTTVYPFMVRFEGEDGKGLRLPVSLAWKLLSGFPKPPSVATMSKWSDDGVAKAVDGSRIEPDGIAASGAPSWILVMGMI